jgi:charged multivesicular body protein 3
VRSIDQEEAKVKKSLKEAAKRGDKTVCTMLAKEIVHSRKTKDRLITSKAQLNSIAMQLQHQVAQVKIAGSLKKSTDIMKMVNRLVRLPEISKDMQEMSREMMKAGIIEEMMNDTLDFVDEPEIEEEAEEEVNKVLFELTKGVLGEGAVTDTNLPVDEDMEARLEALKSL